MKGYVNMGNRTYIPGLRSAARAMCGFIRAYERQIRSRLSTEHEVLLDAALTACSALDAVLDAYITSGV